MGESGHVQIMQGGHLQWDRWYMQWDTGGTCSTQVVHPVGQVVHAVGHGWYMQWDTGGTFSGTQVVSDGVRVGEGSGKMMGRWVHFVPHLRGVRWKRSSVQSMWAPAAAHSYTAELRSRLASQLRLGLASVNVMGAATIMVKVAIAAAAVMLAIIITKSYEWGSTAIYLYSRPERR